MVEETPPTFGEFVMGQIQEALDLTILPIPDADGVLVPYPETLVYADPHHNGMIRGEVWNEWQPHLDDLLTRVALDGVLLSIGALQQMGVEVTTHNFLPLADLMASFYARGYLIGLLEGPDGAAPYERMDTYKEQLKADLDEQSTLEDGDWTIIILDDDTEDTE